MELILLWGEQGGLWKIASLEEGTKETRTETLLGAGNSNVFFMFIPICGEMIQFDVRILFRVGWFNHQLIF